MTSIAVFVMYAISLPCENSRRKEEVPITTSTPSTPVIHRVRSASSIRPSACMRTSFYRDSGIVHMTPDVRQNLGLQSELADSLAICTYRDVRGVDDITRRYAPLRDCSEATGLVSSMYSTPKASNALAIAILVLVSKKALANCSPSGRNEKFSAHSPHREKRCSPRNVLSMMLKLQTLLRKSDARGA